MKRVSLMIFVVGALASYAFAPRTSVLAFQDSKYSDCGNPVAGPIPEKKLTQKDLTDMCSKYHPVPSVVGTAYCLGQDCFKEQNSEHISVVAENSGDFPKTWFAEVKQGELDVTTYACPKCDQCALPGATSGKGVRIEIPPTKNRCKAEHVVGKYLYHDHFASNSAADRRCLVWLECREDKVP